MALSSVPPERVTSPVRPKLAPLFRLTVALLMVRAPAPLMLEPEANVWVLLLRSTVAPLETVRLPERVPAAAIVRVPACTSTVLVLPVLKTSPLPMLVLPAVVLRKVPSTWTMPPATPVIARLPAKELVRTLLAAIASLVVLSRKIVPPLQAASSLRLSWLVPRSTLLLAVFRVIGPLALNGLPLEPTL